MHIFVKFLEKHTNHYTSVRYTSVARVWTGAVCQERFHAQLRTGASFE